MQTQTTEPLPPGMKKFLDTFESKVYKKDTAAILDGRQKLVRQLPHIRCEECGRELQVKAVLPGHSMQVFTYPDAPTFTTKAVCLPCLEKLRLKYDYSNKY